PRRRYCRGPKGDSKVEPARQKPGLCISSGTPQIFEGSAGHRAAHSSSTGSPRLSAVRRGYPAHTLEPNGRGNQAGAPHDAWFPIGLGLGLAVLVLHVAANAVHPTATSGTSSTTSLAATVLLSATSTIRP